MSFDNLNKFLNSVLDINDNVKNVIGRASESTNSAYFIIETNNNYLGLALSDHDGGQHNCDLMDVFDYDDDDCFDEDVFDDVSDELSKATGIDVDMLVECENYGISFIHQYEFNPKKLIGKFIAPQAFVDDAFKVSNAKLIKNNYLLKVDYVSLNGKFTDTKIYHDYIPQTADDEDIATIKYLTDEEDIHEARKLYYKDYRVEQCNNDQEPTLYSEVFRFNGKKYVVYYDDLAVVKEEL